MKSDQGTDIQPLDDECLRSVKGLTTTPVRLVRFRTSISGI